MKLYQRFSLFLKIGVSFVFFAGKCFGTGELRVHKQSKQPDVQKPDDFKVPNDPVVCKFNFIKNSTLRGILERIKAGDKSAANTKDSNGRNPAHLLAIELADNKDPETIKKFPELLKMIKDAGGDVNEADPQGNHPMHLAMRANIPDADMVNVVKSFADAGAGINSIDKDGYDPLMTYLETNTASTSGAVVQCFIDNGINQNSVNANKERAVDIAVKQKNKEALLAILPKTNTTVASGKTGKILLCDVIAAGFDVDTCKKVIGKMDSINRVAIRRSILIRGYDETYFNDFNSVAKGNPARIEATKNAISIFFLGGKPVPPDLLTEVVKLID